MIRLRTRLRRKSRLAVGAVFHMGKIPVLQKRLHLLAGHPQHRPDHPAPGRRNSTQSPEPCAPNQMEQHRLGVVIRRVGRGNFRGRVQGLQKCIPGPPCRILQAPSLGLDPGFGPQSGESGTRRRAAGPKSSSRSDSSPRRPWFKWAAESFRSSCSRKRYRHHSSATESAPPEMAQMTRSPCSKSRCSRQNDRI